MNHAVQYDYDLFVSYTDADQSWVEGYLIDILNQINVKYLSEAEFRLGVPWIQEFQRAVQQSRRTLLVISPAYLADNYREFVDLLGQFYGQDTNTWPVIPLILKPVQLELRLGMLKGLEATTPEKQKAAVEHLCRDLQRPIPKPLQKPSCPYPGMEPFSETNSNFFFGREVEIQQMQQRLRLHSFLAVIGASGSGKSSLVFAGLISSLHQSNFFGSGDWLVHTMRPGETPLATLKSILGDDLSNLTQAVTQVLANHPNAQRLLLVIDQFEELFTQAKTEALPFQQTLLQLIHIQNCYVVITARADFYSDLMRTLLWPEIREYRIEIIPLDEVGLRQAIIKPAETVKVFVELDLVEKLIGDAAGEPGVLPLIQETLVLLWERVERRFLPFRAYEDLLLLPRKGYGGSETSKHTGLQVAIELRANYALAALPTNEEKGIARRIFLRLVQFQEGRAHTRRQQSVAQLQIQADNRQLFDQTLEHLVNRRLLTLSGSIDGSDKKVDIAHEALITGWSTLREWIDEQQKAELIRRKLIAKAEDWVGYGRKGRLLDEEELAEAKLWLNSSDAINLGADEILIELVKASHEAVEKAKQEKEAAQQRELSLIQEALEQANKATEQEIKTRKAAQARTKLAILTAVLSIVALAATGFAWQQQQRTLRVIENLVLRNDEAKLEVIKDLPEFLSVADKSQQAGEIERAIGYYRSFIILNNKFQRQILANPDSFQQRDKDRIQEITKKADSSLLELIQKYRLPRIEDELKNQRFGELRAMIGNRRANAQDLEEQFTMGALRETYKVIMIDTAADINENGRLYPISEANRVPCILIKELENLWRKYTNNQCGWYGYENELIEPKCNPLHGRTLTSILFASNNYPDVILHINSCSIIPTNKI